RPGEDAALRVVRGWTHGAARSARMRHAPRPASCGESRDAAVRGCDRSYGVPAGPGSARAGAERNSQMPPDHLVRRGLTRRVSPRPVPATAGRCARIALVTAVVTALAWPPADAASAAVSHPAVPGGGPSRAVPGALALAHAVAPIPAPQHHGR